MAKSSKKSNRPEVISFRVTDAQFKMLKEIFGRDSAVGVKSTNQLARKWVCDYLAGRLAYADPRHKLADLDTVTA